MEQKLVQQEEEAGTVQETYASLQQEVEIKTKKLKKVSVLLAWVSWLGSLILEYRSYIGKCEEYGKYDISNDFLLQFNDSF